MQPFRAFVLIVVTLLVFSTVRFLRSDSAEAESPAGILAPTYDAEFIASLMREPNTDVMVQRAQDAGLVVEGGKSANGGFYRIIDPSTDQVLFTASLVID